MFPCMPDHFLGADNLIKDGAILEMLDDDGTVIGEFILSKMRYCRMFGIELKKLNYYLTLMEQMQYFRVKE